MDPVTVATYKKIHIDLVGRKPKTNVYDVLTNDSFIESGVTPHHDLLGKILWSPTWRQYVFRFLASEHHDVDMSRSCNRNINDFIQKLMDERKKVSKKRKNKTSTMN